MEKRYVIKLSRRIGENLFDTIVLESTTNKDKWYNNYNSIAHSFIECGYETHVYIYPCRGGFEECHIEITTKID